MQEERATLEENKKNKFGLVDALKLSLSLVLLGIVIWKAGPRQLLQGILQADKLYLMLSVVFILLSHFTGILRWKLLSGSLGIRAKYIKFMVLHFLGLYYNNFLPTGIGGDFVKAHYLGKSSRFHKALLSVSLDRYVGLLVLLVVASFAATMQPQDDFHRTLSYITWGIFVLFAFGGLFALLFSNLFVKILDRFNLHKFAGMAKELIELIRGFLSDHKTMIAAFFISVVSQAWSILAVHEISLAVGGTTEVASMFVIVPLVLMVNVLPISFGGLGTREFVFLSLLSKAYIASNMTPAAANLAAAQVPVLWLVVNIMVSLPGLASTSLISRMRS